VLEDIPRSAAFLSDGGPVIEACNRAAAVAFGLSDGCPMDLLPFDPRTARSGGRDPAHRGRAGGKGGDAAHPLGPDHRQPGDPAAEPDRGPPGRPLALVLSTELVWPEGFAQTVQEAFGLTGAEVEIVRGITLGLPVRDIAEARGRIAETVRTQLRSILAKTETHSQSELVRVVLGLMDVALIPADGARRATHRARWSRGRCRKCGWRTGGG
jgi:DNA-binding CsgD family transcriptional regulator